MSRISHIGVRFDADDSAARRKYDDYRRYVESNPPRVNLTTAPGAAAGGVGSVRTFGGATVEVSTAPAAAFRPVTQLAAVAGAARDPSVIANEMREAIARQDSARYQSLWGELRGTHGTTPVEVRQIERQRRDTARAAARQTNLDDVYETRYENRLVSDAARAASQAERAAAATTREQSSVDRINRQTAVIEAGTRGGLRGQLGELDQQIGGASGTQLANLNRQRAALIERITREEWAEHQRAIAAQRAATAAREREAKQAERAAQPGERGRRLRQAELNVELERDDDPAYRAGVLRERLTTERDPLMRARMQARLLRETRRYSVNEFLTDRFEGAAGLAFGVAAVAHLAGTAETEMRAGESRRFMNLNEQLNADESEIAGRSAIAGAGRRALAWTGRLFTQNGVPGGALLTSRFDDAGVLGQVREAQQQQEAVKLTTQMRDDARDGRARARAVGSSGFGAEMLGVETFEEESTARYLAARERARGLGGVEGQNAYDAATAAGAQATRTAAAMRADVLDRVLQSTVTIESTTQATRFAGAGDEYLAAHTNLWASVQDRNAQALRDTRGLPQTERMRYLNAVSGAGQAQLDALEQTTARGNEIAGSRASYAATASEQARAGMGRESRISAVNAEYVPIFDANNQVVGFKGMDMSAPGAQGLLVSRIRQYTAAVTDAGIAGERDEILQTGNLAASRALARRDFAGASREQIDAERRAALVGQTNQSKRDEINETYAIRQQLAERERGDTDQSLGIGLRGNREILQAQLARDPYRSQAIGLQTAGLQEATGLAQAGYTDRAHEAIKNASLGLDLMRQNYLEGFRGAQVDLRNIDTTGARDSTDPDAVINAIEQAGTQLAERFREALAEIAAR